MPKIVIAEAGHARRPIEIARDFVREQSVGEWDDATVEKDAATVAEIMVAYAKFYNPNGGTKSDVIIEYDG